MRKKIRKVWGKIRKIDRNLRKEWGKWNSCPPGTVRLATALYIHLQPKLLTILYTTLNTPLSNTLQCYKHIPQFYIMHKNTNFAIITRHCFTYTWNPVAESRRSCVESCGEKPTFLSGIRCWKADVFVWNPVVESRRSWVESGGGRATFSSTVVDVQSAENSQRKKKRERKGKERKGNLVIVAKYYFILFSDYRAFASR